MSNNDIKENNKEKVNNESNKKSLKSLVEKAEQKEKIKELPKKETSDLKETKNANTNDKDNSQKKKVVSLSDALKDNEDKEKDKERNRNSESSETKREKVKLDELIKKTDSKEKEDEKGGVISFSEERNKAKLKLSKEKAKEEKEHKSKAKQIEKELEEFGGVKKVGEAKDGKKSKSKNDEDENIYLEDVDIALLGVKPDKPNVILEKVKEAALTALLVIVGLLLLMILPIFNVNELTITNIELLSEEEIKEVINYNKSKNFFHLMTSKPKEKLLTLPEVKDAEVKFTFPSSMIIRIKEIKIAGYIPYLSEYIYIDSEGKIVSISSEKIEGVPLIEGLSFNSFKLGNILDTTNNHSLNIIIEITNVLSKYDITDKISSIDVTNSDSLRLYVGSIEVVIGDIEDCDQKIRIAMEAISKLVAGAKGTLDVSSLNGKAYFKPVS